MLYMTFIFPIYVLTFFFPFIFIIITTRFCTQLNYLKDAYERMKGKKNHVYILQNTAKQTNKI